jgi:hypothetical protein
MVDLNEKEIEIVSGAGPWGIIGVFISGYEKAKEFSRAFWAAAKDEAGLE